MWWLLNVAPHPKLGGRGIRHIETPKPLLTGGFAHIGLAKLRANIVAGDKDWTLDEPLLVMEADAARRSAEGPQVAESLAEAKGLLVAYRDWWGPGGASDERGEVEVLVDEHGPVIERDFATPLPIEPYVWTCRVDMLARWRGWLVDWEIKTVDVRGVWKLFERSGWDMQLTGEAYTLRHHFADQELAGVMVDALVKGRAVKGKSKLDPCYREQTHRTEAALADFERRVVRTLIDVARHHYEYETTIAKGVDPWEAGPLVYSKTGMDNGSCQAYGRACQFLPICLEPDRSKRSAEVNYRPVAVAEAAAETEASELE